VSAKIQTCNLSTGNRAVSVCLRQTMRWVKWAAAGGQRYLWQVVHICLRRALNSDEPGLCWMTVASAPRPLCNNLRRLRAARLAGRILSRLPGPRRAPVSGQSAGRHQRPRSDEIVCSRHLTKFEFEFDIVRTSNVFSRFEIRRTFSLTRGRIRISRRLSNVLLYLKNIYYSTNSAC